MAGVHITIYPGYSTAANGRTVTFGAISPKDDHFSIAGVKPGLYFLQAERNGYVLVPGKAANGQGDAMVSLKVGETTDFTVTMTPRAMIYGHVVDEYGDPIQHAQVDATPIDHGSREFGSSQRRTPAVRSDVAPGKFSIWTQRAFTTECTPTGAIAGRVTNTDSEPVDGATVFADCTRGWFTADEKGLYRIGGLPPGKCRVSSSSVYS